MPRVHPRSLLLACASSLICALTLGVAPAANAAPATLTKKGWKTNAEVWGVNDPALYMNLSDSDLARHIDAIQNLGAKWVRFAANWPRIQEAGPGTFRWVEIDSMVRRLAQAGIRWRPATLDVPQWLKGNPDSPLRQPPTSSDRVAEFLDALIARYGKAGTFWRANRDLVARPIEDIELHNEPNATYFWGMDPATYTWRTDYTGEGWADVYGPALDKISAKYDLELSTRKVRVWMGGLVAPAPLNGIAATQFIYNAFNRHPSLTRTLSGAAMHTYPWSGSSQVYSDPMQAAYAVMGVVYALHVFGRLDMQVQINEFGAAKTRVTDEQNRIAILTAIADLVRSDCPIQGMAPFAAITAEQDPNNVEDWWGLVSPTTGELHADGAAYADRVKAYNAGTVKGAALDACL